MTLRAWIAAVGLLVLSPVAALAQDEIVVTGSRLNANAYAANPYGGIVPVTASLPAVQIKRRADNLIVAVRIVNDTRDAGGRRTEITQTLRALVRSASARPDIDLSIQEDGVLVALTEDMVSTLTLGDSDDRDDTTVADLIVKTPIREGDTLDDASGRIEAFVRGAAMTGRSLAEIYGGWQLTLVDPPQYRSAILTAIAQDATATASAFGDRYAVEVGGLSEPVAWRQSGPLELSLYIPYNLTVTPRP